MHQAIVTLESASPYSQTRYHGTPKEDNETPEQYEERTWKNKMSTDEEGRVFIQAAAFKKCLEASGKYMGMKIKGQGNKTYTQKFKSGVMVIDNVDTGMTESDIIKVALFVPSDGVASASGKGKRVVRFFPTIPRWKGEVTFHVFETNVTKDVLAKHLECMGTFIGVGNYRPEVGGVNGRFTVNGIEWR